MKLKELIWRVLHSKHAHTMHKIATVHPMEKEQRVKNEEAPSLKGRAGAEALDELCSYVEGHSGHITAWCDPVTGRWSAVIKDFAGKFLTSAKADTPIELVDRLCEKIERKRLRQKEREFSQALDGQKGGSNG